MKEMTEVESGLDVLERTVAHHKTPGDGPMPLKGRFRGKSSRKETGAAQFQHSSVEFLSLFDN